jgi:cell division septal protein FtsQ
MKLPVRQPVAGGSARRSQRVAATVLARLAGTVLVVAAGGGLYWLTSAEQFRLDPQAIVINGLAGTSEVDVRERLGIAPEARPNVFRLRAAQMADAVRTLPSVASAEVVVALPDRLEVHVVERQPLLVWRVGERAFRADAEGALISAADPAAGGLQVVTDDRAASRELAVGGRLDEVDVQAARLLLTLTPAELGSRSAGLAVTIDDADGYVLVSQAPAWRAIFGFYTANLRRPADLVPRQRQCLASLIAAGEDRLAVAYLAVSADGCGTYREGPTPSALFFQNVGRSGA